MSTNLSRWTAGIFAGAVGGAINVFFMVSFAALVFAGALSPYVGRGIGFMVFGLMVMPLLTIVFNRCRGIIVTPQDNSAVIMAIVAASLAGGSAGVSGLSGDALFVTVAVGMVAASLLTGACFWLLGRFKLGSLSRFIPYPVIAGFLAGTGWLLAAGGVDMLTPSGFSWSKPDALITSNALWLWAPGAVFALGLLALLRRAGGRWELPGALAASLGLFYLALAATGTSVTQAGENGWLMGPLPSGDLWRPLELGQLALVDWAALAANWGGLLLVVLITFVSMMLNLNGIELATERDMDLNQQLKALGLVNALTGLTGSHPGYPSISFTRLAWIMAPPGHALNLGYALVAGLALLAGASFLNLMPTFVVGGLLLFLGLGYLTEWLVDTWSKMSKSEYAVIVVILLVIANLGVLEGVGVGIVVAALIFLVNYSRTEVVQQQMFGSEARSNVDRPQADGLLLQQQGGRIAVLKLQGYLFFGTGNSLFRRVRALANDADPPLCFVLLDFRRVTGLDSSTEFSFQRMLRLAKARGLTLCLCNVSKALLAQFKRTVLRDASEDQAHVFADTDHALEWCEDQLLAEHAASDARATDAHLLKSFLKATLPEAADVSALMGYFEPLEAGADFVLMRQDQPSDDLYFLESGAAQVLLELPDGGTLRLRKVRAGTFIGEVAMFLGTPRSATVVLSQPGTLQRLTRDALNRMESQDPALAAAFQRLIIHNLAARLTDNSRIIRSLSG